MAHCDGGFWLAGMKALVRKALIGARDATSRPHVLNLALRGCHK